MVKLRCLKTYAQLVEFLLEKYVKNENIAEKESGITHFAEQTGMNALQYFEELVAKSFPCGDVYKAYAIDKIFINCLEAFIR